MPIIAFVDTDISTSRRLKATLAQQRSTWVLHCFESGDELLNLLECNTVDCVVTDMHMQDQYGAQLLGQIAKDHPSIVRIALSGQVDAEMTLESLHAIHRFIAKPAPERVIIEAIERSLSLHCSLCEPRLQTAITGMTTMPVLPEIYNKLSAAMASEDYSIASIAQIIESDIGLSATLLKVVNSPYYGMIQHVKSATHAAQLLGVELVKNILLSEKVLSQFQSYCGHERQIGELNKAAKSRGVLANRFARLGKFTPRQIDHTQVAGMMSNLGDLVLETGMVSWSESNVEGLHNGDLIGCSILGLWSLPDAIVEAVLRQRAKEQVQGSLSVAHVIQTIRQFEQHSQQCGGPLKEEFTFDLVAEGLHLETELLEKWFDCFCDYHRDLQQAA